MFFSLTGLNLEINIEQDDYLGHFTPEAGIKLDISNQGYMPFPLEKGLSLPVGFASTIGLRKVNKILPVKQEHREEEKMTIAMTEASLKYAHNSGKKRFLQALHVILK